MERFEREKKRREELRRDSLIGEIFLIAGLNRRTNCIDIYFVCHDINIYRSLHRYHPWWR